MNHSWVGTEHLLLGSILLGEGVSFNLLKDHGLGLETVRVEVEKQVKIHPSSQIFEFGKYTPGIKKTLSVANTEALRRKQNYVTTEYLLLGLLLERDGVPAQVLRALEVDPALMVTQLVNLLPPKSLAMTGLSRDNWGINILRWFVYGALGPIVLSAFLWNHPPFNFLDPIMGSLGYIFSSVVRIIGHELSHAYVAWLVGYPILSINFGWPGSHFTGRFAGLQWVLHPDPSYTGGGSVLYFPIKSRFFRLKRWAVTAAGPVFDIAWLGVSSLVLYLYVVLLKPEPELFHPVFGFLAGCCLQTAFTVLLATFRYTSFDRNGRILSSDLKKLLKIPFETEEEIFRQTTTSRLALAKLGRAPAYTDKELQEMVNSWLNNGSVLFFIAQKVRLEPERKFELFKKILSKELTKTDRANAIDQYLTDLLSYNSVSMEPQADALSQELLELSNNSVTSRGTRGSILVELGRLEEGKALLSEVVKESSSSIDRFYSHAFLAIAEKKLGNQAGVDTHREAARLSGCQTGLEGPVGARIADL
jgi:hypothetical protein